MFHQEYIANARYRIHCCTSNLKKFSEAWGAVANLDSLLGIARLLSTSTYNVTKCRWVAAVCHHHELMRCKFVTVRTFSSFLYNGRRDSRVYTVS